MRINQYRGEPDLATLVDRLYHFPRPSKARRACAEAALLGRNPHLGDLTRVAPGAAIIVPEVPEAVMTEGSPAPSSPRDVMVAVVRRRIAQLQETVDRRIDRQVQEAQAILEAAKHPDLAKLARKDPAFRKYRSEMTKKAKATIAGADAEKAARRAGFEKLRAHLERPAERGDAQS